MEFVSKMLAFLMNGQNGNAQNSQTLVDVDFRFILFCLPKVEGYWNP